MSIRNIHNIPCPVCKRDTMHMSTRCMDCGNVQQTPSQMRAARVAKFYATHGRYGAEAISERHMKRIRAYQRAERAASPHTSVPQSRGLKFGRERTR